MNIVGFGLCGPGEADRYLEKTLDNLACLCDEVVICGNNVTPKERAAIKRRGFWYIEDNREWGIYQPKIKQNLLEKVAKLRPDWILPMDMDEVFCDELTRQSLEQMALKKAVAYYFYIVNHWNDQNHYWKSGSFWNIRFYKFMPEMGLSFLNKNVHCGLAPPYAYNFGRYAPYHIRHYGLMNKRDRDAKVLRYEKYDPNKNKVGIGAYYEALKADGEGSAYIPTDIQDKVRAEVIKMKQPDKDFNMHWSSQNKKYVILRRAKDGKEIDVPREQAEATIARGGFIFVREVEMNNAVSVAKLPVVDDELECPICGAVTKSKEDLKTHKKTHK